MRFAQGADALQIAECRRFNAGDLFWIEVKIGHSAQQKIRGLWPFPDQRAQFGSRHAYVSRHARDFRLIATSEIRFGTPPEQSSTPGQHRFKRGLALSFLI
jgi:hypothetical protein